MCVNTFLLSNSIVITQDKNALKTVYIVVKQKMFDNNYQTVLFKNIYSNFMLKLWILLTVKNFIF